MSNTQATVKDLIDELTDVLEKGWHLPAGGKSFIDSEDAKQILMRFARRSHPKCARRRPSSQTAPRSSARHSARPRLSCASQRRRQKALVNQEEIVRQAQAKANDIMARRRRSSAACRRPPTTMGRSAPPHRRRDERQPLQSAEKRPASPSTARAHSSNLRAFKRQFAAVGRAAVFIKMSERKRRFKVFSQVFLEKTCGF